jgi:hypothetical protein
MKKLLSALAATLIVSSSAATVVSCGTKPVDSLSSNMIGDKLGYDITNWDASVLAAGSFKDNFLANVNDEFTSNGASHTSLQKLLFENDGKGGVKEGSNIVAKVLADYEATTNQNKNVDKFDEAMAMEDFNVTIYDENAKDTKIASWDGSKWTLEAAGLKIVSFEDDSGQYVYSKVNLVNFAVEITPVEGNTDNFVGAKANLTGENNKNLDKYYNDAIKNGSEDIKNQAALYSNKEWKSAKDHDYRYMIEFNFSAK